MQKALRKSLIAVLLALFAAAGAPLAHVFRVAEVVPASAEAKADSQAQYRLVLASDFDALAKSDKPAEAKKNSSKTDDVRLLKVVDEQWETSTRIEIGHAEVPELPSISFGEPATLIRPAPAIAFVLLERSPPAYPARGPPL